jgi:hypothetical protein
LILLIFHCILDHQGEHTPRPSVGAPWALQSHDHDQVQRQRALAARLSRVLLFQQRVKEKTLRVSRSIKCCALAVVVALVVVGEPASGVTKTVPQQYATIQAAISAASAGDTIRVLAGTYTGPIDVNKSLVLIGSGPDTATTIVAPTDFASNSAYDYSLPGFFPERAIVHIGAASPIAVTFRGFTVDGLRRGPSFDSAGTQQIAYSGILAEQCTVTVYLGTVRNILPADSGSTWDPNRVWNGRGIHVRGASTALIRRNYIEQVNRFHILINATDSTAVAPPAFPTALVDSNVIVGKGVYNGGQKGIWFNTGAWGTIAWNTLSALDYGNYSVEPERASGIVIRYGYLNTVNGSVIHHNSISSSTSTNNKGMYVQGRRETVADNSISGYRWGIEVHAGDGVPVPPETVMVVRNTITGGKVGVLVVSENPDTTSDLVTIGGSPANKNIITGQLPSSQSGSAIALSMREHLDQVNFRGPIPVDARYNDFGVYTSAEILDRLFQASDTTFPSGAPLDTVYFFPFWVPSVTANLRAFLQGPYVTPGDSMTNTLRTGGTLASHFVGTPIPALAVDSIMIELRDSLTAISSTRRLFAPAWLLTDGTIRNFSDTSKAYVQFSDSVSGNFYFVTKHRNHLAIMSSSVVTCEGGSNPTAWDFSTGQSQAYGSNAMKSVGVRFAMYGANGDGNGVVNAIDRNSIWRVQNGSFGYFSGDFNLNGVVNAIDQNSFWRPNNGTFSQVP